MRKFLRFVSKIIIKPLYGRGIGKRRLAYAIYLYLCQHLRTDTANVLGHRMFLDAKDSLHLSIGSIYEPLTTKLIEKEIKKGDVVLDIGAHIGYYTLLFARLVGHEGMVYAFEPEPANFDILAKNIKVNDYRNVTLIQKAVSNKNGATPFYLSEINTGAGCIFDVQDGRKSMEVESIVLDGFFKKDEGKIDFIKIDIEGAEARAIQGMYSLLQENKNVQIVTEFNPYSLKKSGIEPAAYLHMLRNYGFQLHIINEEERKIESTSNSEILERYTPENRIYTNLLCIRPSINY